MKGNKKTISIFYIFAIFSFIFLPKITFAQETYYFADPIEGKSDNESCQEFKPDSLKNDTTGPTDISVCMNPNNIKINSEADDFLNYICCIVTAKNTGDEIIVTEQGVVIDPKAAQEAYDKMMSAQTPKFNAPDFQIDLGINFGNVVCQNNTDGGFSCSVSWIGDYISYIYKYGLSIAGILAALMLMGGGVIWLTSGGDAGKVGKAKTIIVSSITGLLILFSTYLILYQINPELVKLNPITVGYKSDGIIGDSNIPINTSNYSEGLNLFTDITGINCGTDSYSEMIEKSRFKITYDQKKRTTAAPDNKIYLDCSSFASYISTCAGKTGVPDWTGTIFASKTVFNGQLSSLKEGDLLGWPPGSGDGHVYIYLGNGRFGDVNASEKDGVGNYSLDFVLKAVKRHTGNSTIYIKRP